MASGAGTAVDYASFLLLMSAGLSITPAIVIGGVAGALTNFMLARNAVFKARHGRFRRQVLLFGIGAIVSIALNTGAVYALLHTLESAALARAVAIVLVAALFNFPFQKWIVFRVPDAGGT